MTCVMPCSAIVLLESREIGHVALDERDLRHLGFGQDEPQPARVFLQVEDPDLDRRGRAGCG